MTRVRYEVYCQGRLLKVFPQIKAGTMGDLAKAHGCWDALPTVDEGHYWKIDEMVVADDVAQAMLAKYGETGTPN